jgi:hypothetical protein
LEIDKKNGRDWERLIKQVKFSKIFWNILSFKKVGNQRDLERSIDFKFSSKILFLEEENE